MNSSNTISFVPFIGKQRMLRQYLMTSSPTYLDCTIYTQVNWFIYSTGIFSLEVFCDDYFKLMLLAMVPQQKKTPKYPVLTISTLKLSINTEWECFC